jgi:hypothetical protein
MKGMIDDIYKHLLIDLKVCDAWYKCSLDSPIKSQEKLYQQISNRSAMKST